MRKIFFLGLIIFSILCISFISNSHGADNPRETPIVKVVRENASSVVNISTESIVLLQQNPYWGQYGSEFDMFFSQFFGLYNPTSALKLKSVGSGVILDDKGLLVTNAHVVHMASNIFVILNDGTSVVGEIVFENQADDLALVKFAPLKKINAIKLGQTNDLMIGESVVAIGNPLGLENTVTAGIVSGKNREINLSANRLYSQGLLQIDAPINPGNSGGALLNLNGELVGINMAVVQNSQSIGFAIPVEKVKEALNVYQNNKNFIVKNRTRSTPSSNPSNFPMALPDHRDDAGQWDPFAEMDRMREEMDRMFQESLSRPNRSRQGIFNTDVLYDPNFQLQETPSEYQVVIDISGINKDKINIEINQSSITVSGEYSSQTDNSSLGGVMRSESYGSFLKTIPVPEGVDSSKIRTEQNSGMLVIHLPKRKVNK